jgi:hypothetical protein
LVVPVLSVRWGSLLANRAPSVSNIGEAYPDSEVRTSPATACFDSLRPSICAWIDSSLAAGSSIPIGSSAKIADTRLL